MCTTASENANYARYLGCSKRENYSAPDLTHKKKYTIVGKSSNSFVIVDDKGVQRHFLWSYGAWKLTKY
jgi:hypothetical protein